MVGILIIANFAFAGTSRVCSVSQSTSQVNGSWDLLDEGDFFGTSLEEKSAGPSRTNLPVSILQEREVDMCPKYDPYGGLLEANRSGFEMVAVNVDLDEIGGSCPVLTRAGASGMVGGEVHFGMGAIDVETKGGVQLDLTGENTGRINADAGGGGTFDALWRYNVTSETARVQGTILVDIEQAYSGINLNVPDIALVHAWDGMVDAWVRQGEEFVHITGPAPQVLEIDYVAPRSGEICATGGSSVGGFGSEQDGLLYLNAVMKMHIEITPTDAPEDRMVGVGPRFGRCSCND